LSAAFLALAAVSPASAQYWGPGVPPPDYSGRIPPQHIDAMVRSMGYQPVAEPRVRGPLWVTHAVDRSGQQVRVLIDGFSGRVIDVLRRPLPPQRVVAVPPPNFPPQVNGPVSDYEDEGPDYDYRDMPRQRPADWPPSRPNVQQQGPNVIPLDRRGDNRTPVTPKTNTAKKKETKEKKSTAALPEKEKDKVPTPATRPADAPKVDAPKPEPQKADAPQDKPKAAEVPTFVPNADQKPTGSISQPKATPPEVKKNETPSTLPPMQPPF
jgi:hypothetical protein